MILIWVHINPYFSRRIKSGPTTEIKIRKLSDKSNALQTKYEKLLSKLSLKNIRTTIAIEALFETFMESRITLVIEYLRFGKADLADELMENCRYGFTF